VIILAASIVGAILGALLARKRRGNRLDMIQYAAGFAIAFALLGLFASIFLARILF